MLFNNATDVFQVKVASIRNLCPIIRRGKGLEAAVNVVQYPVFALIIKVS